MQEASVYLNIVHDRGSRGLPLNRVYRGLRKPDLFLMAYMNLYPNKGAMTPGADGETVDNMSMKKIARIIKRLERGTFEWKPARRIYVPKANGKQRPISIPSWEDKLVQESMRLVLNAYYEPKFSDRSHGFRENRGCHTALAEVIGKWKGVKWFIEGDYKGCFDNIDHKILLEIIARDIHDARFLKLLREMLEAGYLEDWKYQETYSGVPQGGIVSPLLSNIYLNELDKFVENELISRWTKGKTRRANPEYYTINNTMMAAKKANNYKLARELRKVKVRLPSGDPDDPEYRRLVYVRYADDTLLGFIGTKAEAEEVKQELIQFSWDKLNLEMSNEKTFITHGTTGKARFLGYDVKIVKADSRKWKGRRSVNYQPVLEVPNEVITRWVGKYTKKGKPTHRPELIQDSDYDIVMAFQMEFQGVVNYYTMAHNVSKWYRVKSKAMQSLVKTLAAKHKCRITRIYRKHKVKTKEGITAIRVTVPRKDKKPLVATFGGKPIRYNRRSTIIDKPWKVYTKRTELADRLLADKCELCGSTESVRVHHIKALKDLRKRYCIASDGIGEKPQLS